MIYSFFSTTFLFIHPSYLFFGCLAYMGGVIAQANGLLIVGLLIASCSIILLYFLSYRITYIFFLILFFIMGAGRHAHVINKHSHHFALLHKKNLTIKGLVSDRILTTNYPFCTRLTIKANSVTDQYGTCLLNGCNFFVYSNTKKIQVGDYILLQNITCNKPKSESFFLYLLKENITGALFCQASSITLCSGARCLPQLIYLVRNTVFNQLRNKIHPSTFSLVATIFLGNRAAVKEELSHTQKIFAKWGIVHYLARSGLHVLLLIILWNWLICFLGLSHTIRMILVTILISLYGLLTWSSISFIRALAMFYGYQLCIIAQLPIQSLHLLSLVAFLLLLHNPIQLFYLDFQLSFGLTFIIAWLNVLQAKKRISGFS